MKKLLSICVVVAMLLSTFAVSSFAALPGEITIISPSASCTTDISEIKVDCDNAKKIIFELDGVKIGETDGEIVLPLEPGTISAGNHILRVSAIFNDDTASQAELNFDAKALITVKQSTQNFDTYVSGKHSDVGISLESRGGKMALAPDVGRSGEDGDLSLKAYYTVNDWLTNQAGYFTYTPFKDYGAKGLLTLNFSLKVSDRSRASMWMQNMHLVNSGLYILNLGKVPGSNYDITALSDGWMDFSFVHNYSSGNTLVTINGKEAYNAPSGKNGYEKNSIIQFNPMQQKTVNNESERLTWWFDNFDFKQELVYGLKQMYYGSDDEWTSCAGTKIPADTPKLKLVMTESLDASTITADTVTLWVNGTQLLDNNITYNPDENSIIITPAQNFDKGSDIVVRLADTVKLKDITQTVGIPLEARVTTQNPPLTPTEVSFKNNGSPLISGSQLKTGDSISVDVTLNNDSSESKPMAAIVAVIQNGKMRSVSAVQHTLGSGTTLPVTVSLPPLSSIDSSGDVSVKLMICDTLGSTLAYTSYIEIK